MENDKIMLIYRIKVVKDNSNILLFRQVKNDPASVKLLGAFFYVSDMKSKIIMDFVNNFDKRYFDYEVDVKPSQLKELAFHSRDIDFFKEFGIDEDEEDEE